MPQLSESDVRRLLQDRSATSRAGAARKIADEYTSAALNPRERHLAEEIFRVMVRDPDTLVREALSGELYDCPGVAHDVIRALADDVESVALPVIRTSTVLTDEDLIDIVRKTGRAKRKAVIARPSVPALVADALVEADDEEVTAALMANAAAEISERALQRALDAFGENEAVSRAMALRARLPVRVAERLVGLVSEKLRMHLLARHEVSGVTASDVILESRERATLGLFAGGGDRSDAEALVVELHSHRRLTPSIVLRALCMGDVAFFEAALARLAGIPPANAGRLIHDDGGLGLRALAKKAGLAETLLPALKVGIEACREVAYDGGESDRERFRRRVIERVLTRLNPVEETALGAENLAYLVAKLRPDKANFAKLA
jgi:uncharacterized protein (DUF2336 family)